MLRSNVILAIASVIIYSTDGIVLPPTPNVVMHHIGCRTLLLHTLRAITIHEKLDWNDRLKYHGSILSTFLIFVQHHPIHTRRLVTIFGFLWYIVKTARFGEGHESETEIRCISNHSFRSWLRKSDHNKTSRGNANKSQTADLPTFSFVNHATYSGSDGSFHCGTGIFPNCASMAF